MVDVHEPRGPERGCRRRIAYYLRTDDRVFEETPGVYVDDNSQIQLEVTTAWLLDDVLQGLQLVYHLHLLGARLSAPARDGVSGRLRDALERPDPGRRARVRWFALRRRRVRRRCVYGGSGEAAYPVAMAPVPAVSVDSIPVPRCGGLRVAGAAYEITELSLTGGVKRQALRPFPAARTT